MYCTICTSSSPIVERLEATVSINNFGLFQVLNPVPVNTVLASLKILVIIRLLMEDDTLLLLSSTELEVQIGMQCLPVPLVSLVSYPSLFTVYELCTPLALDNKYIPWTDPRLVFH